MFLQEQFLYESSIFSIRIRKVQSQVGAIHRSRSCLYIPFSIYRLLIENALVGSFDGSRKDNRGSRMACWRISDISCGFVLSFSDRRGRHKRRRSFRLVDTEPRFIPQEPPSGISATIFLEMYGNRMRARACAVWKDQTGRYFGNKNPPADLFADLICDLDRGRYLWPPARRYSWDTRSPYLHVGMNKYESADFRARCTIVDNPTRLFSSSREF